MLEFASVCARLGSPYKLENAAIMFRFCQWRLPDPTSPQSVAPRYPCHDPSLLPLRLQRSIPLWHFPVSVIWHPTFVPIHLATSAQIPVPFSLPRAAVRPQGPPPLSTPGDGHQQPGNIGRQAIVNLHTVGG